MTDVTTLLHRYMNLIEGIDRTVSVTIEAYVGIEQQPGDSATIPANLTMEVDSGLSRDEMTAAIKAQIQIVTGYEPARFKWRPISGEAETPKSRLG